MRPGTRRALRWLGISAAVLLLAASAAVAWLVTTEAGLRRAVALVESIDALHVRIEGASGRLIGPLRIGSLAIDHPRAEIRVAGFEADYEPLELLGGRIAAEGVRIADVSVTLRPGEAPAAEPGFLPAWLSVAIDDARIGRLRLYTAGGTMLALAGIQASARLTRHAILFKDLQAAAPGWAVAGASGRLRAGRPIAMDVGGDWLVTGKTRVAGSARAAGDLDRIKADVRLATPALGRVTAEFRDLDGTLRWMAKAQIEKLDLAQWSANPPFGPLRSTLELSGDRERYELAGVVLGEGLPEDGLRLKGRARYADRVVTVPSLELAAADATVRMNGSVTTGDAPRYELRAEWTRFQWPLAGRPMVRSATGTLSAQGYPETAFRLAGEFEPAAGPPVAGEATGRLMPEALFVDESTWRALGGRVWASGSLARGDSRHWTLKGRAEGVDPAAIREDFPGRLSFAFSGSGEGFDCDVGIEAGISSLGGRLRGQPASGRGTVRCTPGRIEFRRVALALGRSRLTLDGSWGGPGRLDARAVSDDLSDLAPELAGKVDATLTIRDRVVDVALRGHDLAWGGHKAIVLSADGHVDRQGAGYSWMRVRSNGLTVAGLDLTDMRLSLDGLARDHGLVLRLGAGSDAVELRGRGAWIEDRYALRLDELSASGPRLAAWRLEAPSRVTATAGEAGVEPVCIVYRDRRICVEGSWQQGGAWSVKATTDAFPLDVLDSEDPDGTRFRGQLFVNATASARAGEPFTANAMIELRDGALYYRSASGAERTVNLGDTRATLVSDAESHRLELHVTDADALRLDAEVEAARVAGQPLGELPLRGTVKGASRQLGLLPLVVDAIDDAGGDVDLDFTIAGRLRAPRLEGHARLEDGKLDFYQANLRLRDLRADLSLDDTTLAIDAEGKAGEGTMQVDGKLGWRNRRLRGELALRGENLLLADVPEARVNASPDLRFVIGDGRARVTGRVVVPSARIAPADTAGAVLASADEQVVSPDDAAGPGKLLVTTDVSVTLEDKVAVRAYGLRGNVKGSVRMQSAPHEGTVASGDLDVVDGVYKAYGRELEVERGRLLFTGGPVSDPGVDLRAKRELPGYEVGVIARGPLRKPQLTLFSEPSLPQYQIASMLIVGRTSIQSEGEGDGFDSSDATEGGAAFLAGQLGKYVGLDEVGVTQDADTGTELVIGKYLTPRLFVSYGISLVEEINTLKLRYTLDDRWTLSAESGLEVAADVEYRIEDN